MVEAFDFKWYGHEEIAKSAEAHEQPESEGMVTTEQTRRSIADRVIARARARGTPIDDDPEYMAIVELWVVGEISIQEMRRRYIALLQERSRTTDHLATAIDEARADEDSAVPDMGNHSNPGGFPERDPALGGVAGT